MNEYVDICQTYSCECARVVESSIYLRRCSHAASCCSAHPDAGSNIIETHKMSDKKELVKSMSVYANTLMALMPVSVVTSAGAILTADSHTLTDRMSGVALFYLTWALLNKFTTKPYEKGHFPLGILLAGCMIKGKYGGYLAVVGSFGTWIAFAVASTRVFSWPASKTAYVSKKTLVWARVLQAYFAASLCTWAYFTFRIAQQVISS